MILGIVKHETKIQNYIISMGKFYNWNPCSEKERIIFNNIQKKFPLFSNRSDPQTTLKIIITKN